MEIVMRRARQSDAAAINAICNGIAQTQGLSLEIDPKAVDYRERWLSSHGKRHPVFVGTAEERVLCWAALSPYGPSYAFDFVASVELGILGEQEDPELTNLLLRFLERQAQRLGYYKLTATLEADRAILHTYRQAGYRDVGTLRGHGYCRGKLVDLILMERLLPPDMAFLQQYYAQRYPFYDQYFREIAAREEALRLRNSKEDPGDEFEEVPAEDPHGLPEGIVRFLRSKKRPDGAPLYPQPPTAPAVPTPPAAPVAQVAPVAAAKAPTQPSSPAPKPEPAPAASPAPAAPPAPAPKPAPAKPRPKKSRKSADPDGPLEGQLLLEDLIQKV